MSADSSCICRAGDLVRVSLVFHICNLISVVVYIDRLSGTAVSEVYARHIVQTY